MVASGKQIILLELKNKNTSMRVCQIILWRYLHPFWNTLAVKNFDFTYTIICDDSFVA